MLTACRPVPRPSRGGRVWSARRSGRRRAATPLPRTSRVDLFLLRKRSIDAIQFSNAPGTFRGPLGLSFPLSKSSFSSRLRCATDSEARQTQNGSVKKRKKTRVTFPHPLFEERNVCARGRSRRPLDLSATPLLFLFLSFLFPLSLSLSLAFPRTRAFLLLCRVLTLRENKACLSLPLSI